MYCYKGALFIIPLIFREAILISNFDSHLSHLLCKGLRMNEQ